MRGDLAGHYRIRTGDWRVVFRVADHVIIVRIDHRSRVYEDEPMERIITMTIDGSPYVAIPAAAYQRMTRHGVAEGLAGTDALAYARQSVAHDLRAARAKARLTQAALAKALGVTQGNVANIEAGRTRIGTALVRRWLAACRLPASWKPA